MRVKVIDFVNLVSNCLLSIIDGLEEPILDTNGRVYIDLTNEANKEKLSYLISSYLKTELQFGYMCIIVNTCPPNNNWRQQQEQFTHKLTSNRYLLNDNTVSLNYDKLNIILNENWNVLLKNKNKSYILLENESLDLIDLNVILSKLLHVEVQPRPNYYILIDANQEYFPHDSFIPNYLIEQIETVLRENELII